MKVRVFVSLKPTVLDPQGQAIRAALNAHGHPSVGEVRVGKYFDMTVNSEDEGQRIAQDVLANPVIEDFRVEPLD